MHVMVLSITVSVKSHAFDQIINLNVRMDTNIKWDSDLKKP